MQENLDYWQSVYAASKVPTFPSQFAIFVQSWLSRTDCRILEFGCGNGRDALFFHKMGHKVVALDQVIGSELETHSAENSGFSAIQSSIDSAVESVSDYVDFDKPLALYSRFFQHAIPERDQLIMLQSLSNVLHQDSILFFEFRLADDKEKPKEFGTTHFRRYQSSEKFISLLGETNFDCVFTCEGEGFARYKDEEPYVGRFVAVPKKKKADLTLVQGRES